MSGMAKQRYPLPDVFVANFRPVYSWSNLDRGDGPMQLLDHPDAHAAPSEYFRGPFEGHEEVIPKKAWV